MCMYVCLCALCVYVCACNVCVFVLSLFNAFVSVFDMHVCVFAWDGVFVVPLISNVFVFVRERSRHRLSTDGGFHFC